MRKNIYSLLLLAGVLLSVQTACEDGKDEYLSDFSTILYFRNSGEVALTLYKTGETTDYQLAVVKAGSDLNATASVDVSVMNEAALEAYNQSEGTDYRLVPASCYTLSASQLQFASSDLYKAVDVAISPEEVENSMTGSGTPVIPLELTNASADVNADMQYLFLNVQDVQTPTVGFETGGYVAAADITESSGTVTIEQSITMPITSLWDFSCTVEVDQTVLNDYNTENDENLSLVAADAYTIEVGSFTAGTSTVNVSITVDISKLTWGKQGIPLRITGISNPNFEVNATTATCIVGINHKLPELTPTTDFTWTSYGILDASYGDGLGVPGLFDGNLTTHCHGDYGWTYENDAVYGQYIDFHFTSALTLFAYDFWTRSTNANGAPVTTDLYVSNDGSNWTKLATVNTAFSAGGEEFDSDAFSSDEPFTYLRFAVVQSNAGDCRTGSYWNGAEMKLYGK